MVNCCKKKKTRGRKKKTRGRKKMPIELKLSCSTCRRILSQEVNPPFEQFLTETHRRRKSHQSSADVRRYAEEVWNRMDKQQKQTYEQRAQQRPYVFQTKDENLCKVMIKVRTALKCKQNINLVELMRAARYMCHWKYATLKRIKSAMKKCKKFH